MAFDIWDNNPKYIVRCDGQNGCYLESGYKRYIFCETMHIMDTATDKPKITYHPKLMGLKSYDDYRDKDRGWQRAIFECSELRFPDEPELPKQLGLL